jgi:hypothetical protein
VFQECRISPRQRLRFAMPLLFEMREKQQPSFRL